MSVSGLGRFGWAPEVMGREPEVIFVVVNGAVEFLFGVFGYTCYFFSLVLSSFLSYFKHG